MDREIIDSVELQRLMTKALQAMEEDYKDCQFNGIKKYREPDDEGCNWSPPSIHCSGMPGAVCEADARYVTKTFRAKYNIK